MSFSAETFGAQYIMLVDRGLEITDELIAQWQEHWRVIIPGPIVEFWKVYGNGGLPDPECIVPIRGRGSEMEESSISTVLGIFQEDEGTALEKYFGAIPAHLPLFPFACDDGGAMYAVSLCPTNFGWVYQFFTNDVPIYRTSDLFFVARSPIEMFTKFTVHE